MEPEVHPNTLESLSLVPYSEAYLDHSWQWLNDPEIKQLTMTSDFDQDSQRRWFATLHQKQDYMIRGVEAAGIPIGACGLKNITADSAEYWGYIGDKTYWGRGAGQYVIREMLKAAEQRGLKRLWLRVSDANSRAMRLYSSNGFGATGSDDGVITMQTALTQ